MNFFKQPRTPITFNGRTLKELAFTQPYIPITKKMFFGLFDFVDFKGSFYIVLVQDIVTKEVLFLKKEDDVYSYL